MCVYVSKETSVDAELSCLSVRQSSTQDHQFEKAGRRKKKKKKKKKGFSSRVSPNN